MYITNERRFPCCGSRIHVDFAPGVPARRRCRACRKRFVVELVANDDSATTWRLRFESVDEHVATHRDASVRQAVA